MRRRSAAAAYALSLVSLALGACGERAVGRGNLRALAPLIGGGGADVAAAKPPSEPVQDYVADLGALEPAWPQIAYQLPRLIRAVIARGSWIDMHHAVDYRASTLRVRHRPPVIAEVKKLVAELSRRLSRPLVLQVAFVEAAPAVVAAAFPTDRSGLRRFAPRAFRDAVGRKQARTLARAMFSAYNGVWSKSERLGSQVFLSGVNAYGGVVTPRTTTLASGATLQAAGWRWGEQRAVVALTGSYTGEAVGGAEIEQTVHSELPRQKTTEQRWQSHDVKFRLPVRQLIEFQNTLVVERGRWSVAALVPRQNGRLCGVIVKVDWQPLTKAKAPVRIDPLAKGHHDFALQIIPVALPLEQHAIARAGHPQPLFEDEVYKNRSAIKAHSATRWRVRAERNQARQKKRTFNFQSSAGRLTMSYRARASATVRSRTYLRKTQGWSSSAQRYRRPQPSRSALGALPPALEQLKAEIAQARWPAGTAVEFIANHVFVVHRRAVIDKLARLLRETHRWRNQRVITNIAFPLLAASALDGLSDARVSKARAAKLRSGRTLLPSAYVVGRGGSRAEMFVGQMHTVLSGAWAPNATSPSVQVYWKGARLAITPRLGRDDARGIALQMRHYRLSRLQPRTVAAAVLQQPIDATWTHSRALVAASETGVLTGVSSTARGVLGLLVSTRWRP